MGYSVSAPIEAHVHRLDGIGGVNDAPYLWRVIKERRDARPVAAPGFDDGRIFRTPLFIELIEPDVGLIHGGGGIDGFQVSCNVSCSAGTLEMAKVSNMSAKLLIYE